MKKNQLKYWLFCTFWLVFISASAQNENDDADFDPCVQKMEKSTERQFKKARDLQKNGKKQEAFAIFNEILEDFPDNLEVNYYLGLGYYLPIEMADFKMENQTNAKKAVAAFDRIYQTCPYFKIHVNLYAARLSYLMEDFPNAIKFAKVLVDNPDLVPKVDQIEEANLIIKKSAFFDQLLNHPVPFDPHPVAGISTSDDEYLATISPDDEYIYFTRRQMVKDDNFFETSYSDKEFFSFSKRGQSGEFGVGKPLPYPFNQSSNEGSPAINLRNDLLIFARVTTETINGAKYPNYDLYFSELVGDEWTAPQSLGATINQKDSWESQPTLSSNGKMLFFASDRPGGFGGSDIWYAERNSDGSWRKPQNLGPTINTPGNERSPFLHTDSKTLYFSSSGHDGIGGMDIFYSKLNSKNQWEKPVNIGYPINSENDDVDFFVSLDGKTAFFSSNNLGNKDWNIYQFSLYEAARPRNMILIKGNVTNETGETINATVEIRDSAANIIATTTVNENSGHYALATEVDKEKPQDLIINIKKDGHAYDTKLITAEQLEKPVVTNNAEVKKVEVGSTYNLHDIYFATNDYSLTARSKSVIDLFVEFLTENPSVKVEIQGHTDNVGNDAANQLLSERRAQSVYDYVLSKGIASARLRYKGYGESSPIATNNTAEGRAKNRRTIFLIYEQ